MQVILSMLGLGRGGGKSHYLRRGWGVGASRSTHAGIGMVGAGHIAHAGFRWLRACQLFGKQSTPETRFGSRTKLWRQLYVQTKSNFDLHPMISPCLLALDTAFQH